MRIVVVVVVFVVIIIITIIIIIIIVAILTFPIHVRVDMLAWCEVVSSKVKVK